MAVPILDTSFVIAKRLKYKRSPFAPDQNHFYHRFMRDWLFAAPDCGVPASLGAACSPPMPSLLRFEPPRPCSVTGSCDNTLIALGVGMRRVLAASGLDGLHARDPQVAPPPGAPAGQARGRARARGSRRARDHRGQPALERNRPSLQQVGRDRSTPAAARGRPGPFRRRARPDRAGSGRGLPR